MTSQNQDSTLVNNPGKLSTQHYKFLLFLLVSITGASVMIIELLGTRIIAPFFGASLYVWSALISVTMIALALGYYLGGFLTVCTSKFRLSHVLLLSAIATALIPFLSPSVLQLCNPLGMRYGTFISALLLFLPALMLLAMTGPFVIKLSTQNLQLAASVAGSVYAISTIGSVLGTLLLSFYLLPTLGTRAIIFSVSGVLLFLGGVIMLIDGFKHSKASSLGVLSIATLAIIGLSFKGYHRPEVANQDFKIIHAEESIYGWVKIVDNQKAGTRLLLSDASVLSATSLKTGATLLGYQSVMGLLPQFRPNSHNALLIGLGGGHVAMDLTAKGLITDTIEIDPAIAQAALDYFNFKASGEFLVGDARYEINKLHKSYDFIIHDCFTGGSEPIHLLTTEMLTQLKTMLNVQGILALNYVGYTYGEGSMAVASVHRTLKQIFPNVQVFTTTKDTFTDFIFLASSLPIEVDKTHFSHEVYSWLQNHQFLLDASQGIILSDNYNPLESMQIRKSEEYRKIFMQRVSPDILIL